MILPIIQRIWTHPLIRFICSTFLALLIWITLYTAINYNKHHTALPDNVHIMNPFTQ